MKQLVIILILFWLGWHLSRPVSLIGTDLGRHIKNGELILNGNKEVLYENYYSYTNTRYPFILHNWLFGVSTYVLWHYLGFTGLSFIYFFLELLTFYVFFRCWQRHSSFSISCAFALLSIPLISFQTQIRPEEISYLFCGLFLWLIDYYQQRRLNSLHLMAFLCILQVLWVNFHLFFILGPLIVFFFWLQAWGQGNKVETKNFLALFSLLLGMCLINPSGINGFLLPFKIFSGVYFSYKVLENQPVLSLLNSHLFNIPALYYFLILCCFLMLALFILIRRDGVKKHILVGSLSLILVMGALKSFRLIGLFGYFSIPLSAYILDQLIVKVRARKRKIIEIVIVALGVIASAYVNSYWNWHPTLGLVRDENDLADFMKRENIRGVIFNSENIGSYLIFHFSPMQKVFVDNRWEAYSPDFLKSVIDERLKDENFWHSMEHRYQFNAIVLSPVCNEWMGRFIIHRTMDPSWAMVFIRPEGIIFLKRNAQNEQMIKRNEILFDSAKISNSQIILSTKKRIYIVSLRGTSELNF